MFGMGFYSARHFSCHHDVAICVDIGKHIRDCGETVSCDNPRFDITAPQDIGSSAATGSGTTVARADHVHRGVLSVAKSYSLTIL
jgi:hypothetical protein